MTTFLYLPPEAETLRRIMTDRRLLLRVSEAATMLSISRSRAYELIHQGIIPSRNLGGTLRVPFAELQAMVSGDTLQAKEDSYATN
jgi:excisionase family DNA binding protein